MEPLHVLRPPSQARAGQHQLPLRADARGKCIVPGRWGVGREKSGRRASDGDGSAEADARPHGPLGP